MPPDPDNEAAGAELHRSIMASFCRVLHATRLPPMTVMSLAAAVVGSIYREVADEHRSDGACRCGWQPYPAGDVEALQAALAAATQAIPLSDLRVVQAAGRA
jgi:hypothetical protein